MDQYFSFGKYKGKSFSTVASTEARYCKWVRKASVYRGPLLAFRAWLDANPTLGLPVKLPAGARRAQAGVASDALLRVPGLPVRAAEAVLVAAIERFGLPAGEHVDNSGAAAAGGAETTLECPCHGFGVDGGGGGRYGPAPAPTTASRRGVLDCIFVADRSRCSEVGEHGGKAGAPRRAALVTRAGTLWALVVSEGSVGHCVDDYVSAHPAVRANAVRRSFAHALSVEDWEDVEGVAGKGRAFAQKCFNAVRGVVGGAKRGRRRAAAKDEDDDEEEEEEEEEEEDEEEEDEDEEEGEGGDGDGGGGGGGGGAKPAAAVAGGAGRAGGGGSSSRSRSSKKK